MGYDNWDEAQSVLLLSHFGFCDVIYVSGKKKGRGEENLLKGDGSNRVLNLL